MNMRPTEMRWIRAIACGAIALAIAARAGATTLERMSLEQIAVAAPVIVRARCVGNSVVRDAGEIWTLTSFDGEETWRGAPPARITVRLLFRKGEDVVLFLQPVSLGDFSVVSWEQGTFRVHRDALGAEPLVTQDTASFTTFDPATRQFRAAGIRNMPLDQFRARVETALKAAEAEQR
jgi:hypothetical protein